MESKEIGLKLFTSCVEPPLWIATTLDTLSESGKMPELNDRFIILQRGLMIRSATSFNSLRGMLCGPVYLLGKEFIMVKTSSLEMCAIINSN